MIFFWKFVIFTLFSEAPKYSAVFFRATASSTLTFEADDRTAAQPEIDTMIAK